MTEKLQAQVDGTEWSWKNLNTVNITLDYGIVFRPRRASVTQASVRLS